MSTGINVVYQQLTNTTYLFADINEAKSFFDAMTVPFATASSGGVLIQRPQFVPGTVTHITSGDWTSLLASLAITNANLSNLIIKLNQAGAINTES